MFIVFECNLLDINKIILLNIKKNLNFYSLDKHELDSSEYFYIDYNNFNSLESVIHVNKQFEYYDNFKENSLIHFLNIYNLSFFEQIDEFKKEIFIKSICEFMTSNGVLIKSDVNFLFLFNELRIIWSVLIFYDYLQRQSKRSLDLVQKVLEQLSKTNELLSIIPKGKFKQAFFMDSISNFEDKNLLNKTLSFYIQDVLNNNEHSLPSTDFEFKIDSNHLKFANKNTSLLNFYWNLITKSMIRECIYKLCARCKNLFSTENKRKLFCSYNCKNRQSSEDSDKRSKNRRFIRLKTIPGLSKSKPYKIIT